MEWIVSHQSALEFWRKAFSSEALTRKKLRSTALPTKPLDARELRLENPWRLGMPLHILVGNENSRKVSKSIKSHICTGKLPNGSFIQAASGLIASSPELTFLHMANELAFPELVALGYELCGSYRLDSDSEPDRGFRDDQPLTSVSKLSSYLTKAVGLSGHKNASKALRYIADNSASPMETILAILLTFPYRLGGYGFPKPLMNCPLRVSLEARKKMGGGKYSCDLYWPDEQVDVEYDSDTYHAEQYRIAKDAIRRNALSSAGVAVVTVTRKQVVSTAQLREVAEVLGKLLEKRLMCPMPEFTAQHVKLRSQLLPKCRWAG
jgi:very-short-patch-repair endonuclease